MGKNEIYKWMKRSLKNKVSITGKMLVIFLVSGTLSQAGSVPGTSLAGGEATPSAENSVAIGNEAKASFKEAFAIGTGAKSNSLGAYAFGYFAEIGQNSDFAYSMGWYSRIRNGAKHSYAIGHYAEVQENAENAYAIGKTAIVKKGSTSSYAIGERAETNSINAYAIGQQANVQEKSDHAYAIGHLSKVDKNAQHSYTLGSHAKIGQGASSAYALGYESEALKRQSYAIGHKASTNAASSYALGDEAKVNEDSDYGYAIGHRAEVDRSSKYSYAIGYEAKVGPGVENVYAIGREAKAMAKNSLVFGSNTTVAKSAENTVALGSNISGATESNSVYLGNGSTHGTQYDTTMGKGSYANTTINGHMFKDYAGINAYGVVTVGKKDQERRIQNVAAGWINPKSTDAVNGSQLYSVAKTLVDKLDDVVKYDKYKNKELVTLEGGAKGTKITNLQAGTVSSTSKDAVNGSQLHQVEQKINNIVKYDANSDKKKVTLEGNGGTIIANVKDGAVTANSKEAVNGSQLHRVEQKVNNNTTSINNLNTKVNKNTNDITNIQNELKNVVKYDNGTKDKVTLKGTNGTIIDNVKDGDVNANSKQAVNGSQLYGVKQKVEQNTTNITKIEKDIKNVVKYDGDSHDTITLKNGGTTIKNVKAATQDDEAVNLGQLKKTEKDLTEKGLTFAANKGADKKVKLGEKVEIKGSDSLDDSKASDKNVMTSISGNKITVKIATRPEFDEVKAGTGDKKVVIGENKIELGGKTYITNTGINANNQKIINVATPTDNNDAANKKYVDDQIKNVSGSFSGTLKYEADNNEEKTLDLKTGKLKLKGDNKNVTTKTEADGTVRFGLKEILELNKLRIDGTNGYITGLTNTTWNSSNVVENRAASEGQLKQVEQKLDNKISNNTTNIQQNKTDITNIKKELDNVVKYDKNSDKGKVTLEGKNGGTTIDNVKDGKIAAGSKEAVNGGQINDIKKDIQNNTTNIQQNKTDITNIKKELDNVVKYDKNSDKGKVTLEGKNGGTTIDNVKDGKIAAGSKEAVNGGQLHDVEQKIKDVDNKIKDQGLTFKGNDGQHKAKLGSEFNIKGGNSLQEADAEDKNIRTTLKGNTLHMQFAKRPDFEKVTAGTGPDKVSIGDDGVKIGDKTYVSKDGLNANGKKITNVADGTADSDAVNYGQLKKMMQNNGNVDEKIKTLDSKLSGAVGTSNGYGKYTSSRR